jgi:hypothetical protein
MGLVLDAGGFSAEQAFTSIASAGQMLQYTSQFAQLGLGQLAADLQLQNPDPTGLLNRANGLQGQLNQVG